MRFFNQIQILFYIMVSIPLVSCMDCNTEGCDALRLPAQTFDVGQGLAGACANPGDTVVEYLGETCQECPLGHDGIFLWQTEVPVSSAQDASAVCSASPFKTINCDGRYEAQLDIGNYLACSQNYAYANGMSCVNFVVVDDEITTLNTASMGYMPSLYLSEPGGRPALIDEPILATCALQ